MTNEKRMYTAEEVKKIVEYAKGYDLNMRILMKSENASDGKQAKHNSELFLNGLREILDDEQLLDEITEVDPWDVDEDCLPIMLPAIKK